jgi:hypothetical protein
MAGLFRGEAFDTNKDIPDLSGRVRYPNPQEPIDLLTSQVLPCNRRLSRHRVRNSLAHPTTQPKTPPVPIKPPGPCRRHDEAPQAVRRHKQG